MTPIKTALLSFGMSGRVFHAPFINLHDGFELAGSWERSKQAMDKIYPGVTSYPTLEAVLGDDTVSLIIVNTPTHTHYEYTKAALLAGKHVVVEKAFTCTLQEALDLKALEEKTGKKIAVFQSRRWDSDFKTVKKIKDSGLLGDIVEASLRYDRYKPEIGPKLHKEVPNPGSGMLNDLGPHLIDQALVLFGMPHQLFADLRVTRPQSQVDDWFTLTLRYPNCRVNLTASFYAREPIPSFALQGTIGSFIKNRGDIQELNLLSGMKPDIKNWGFEPESESGFLHTEKDGVIIKEKIKTEQGNYYYFYDDVHKAITENKQMPVTSQDGVNVMTLIEAAVKSNKEGRVIDL
jgi:scyllo-inositol 2-dehydrogenase (NADP+)